MRTHAPVARASRRRSHTIRSGLSGTGLRNTVRSGFPRTGRRPARPGFTLVEILVATVLTLLMMGMAAQMFALISDSVRGSRALVEASDRQRAAQKRLDLDLSWVTASMLPPLRPENGEGYFEYIEGPGGVVIPTYFVGRVDPDRDGVGPADTTFGDSDDILMFTMRSKGDPFVGRFTQKQFPVAGQTPDGNDAVGAYVLQTMTVESRVAEVAWFVRGNTLYRRILLVLPGDRTVTDLRTTPPLITIPTVTGFYGGYDISVHQEGGTLDRTPVATAARLVPNTLGDLTRRENRFGHQPFVFPYDLAFWGDLRLPTLRECSAPNWPFPWVEPFLPGAAEQSNNYADAYSQLIVPNGAVGTRLGWTLFNGEKRVGAAGAGGFPPGLNARPNEVFDAWSNPHPWLETQAVTGTLMDYYTPAATRIAEDVILTNVIGFDVKAYDPGAPILQDTATPPNTLAPGDPAYLPVLTSGSFTQVGFGAYVDLGYAPTYLAPAGAPQPYFNTLGDVRSHLAALPSTFDRRVYDTGSTHYEHDGINQDGDLFNGLPLIDEGADGVDNDGLAGVDDEGELEAPPPYRRPLRGIQVKIRTFEPDTKQVREVTVVKSFLPD